MCRWRFLQLTVTLIRNYINHKKLYNQAAHNLPLCPSHPVKVKGVLILGCTFVGQVNRVNIEFNPLKSDSTQKVIHRITIANFFYACDRHERTTI